MPGSRLYRSRSDSHLQKLIKKRMAAGEQQVCDDDSIALRFQNDGFVGPIQVLSQEETQQAYQEYNEWVLTQKLSGDLRFKPHLYLPFVNRIAHHAILVKAVQQALHTNDILLWSSDFNVKEPNTDGCFAPHQDSTYAGLSPPNKCCTAWVALSDPVDKGCLEFWKGSHKQGQLPHDTSHANNNNMLSRGQHLVEPLSNKECVAIPLRGGEATLHSFFTVHSSGPNHSSQPRVGLALRYIAASVIQTGKTKESVTLISGSLQHDGFHVEPILPLENPSEADICKGKEAHKEAVRREAANYFDGVEASGYDERSRATSGS